jgi:transposase
MIIGMIKCAFDSASNAHYRHWRRLRDWQQAGVWEQLHHRLLNWLGDDGQVEWSRAAIDSVSVRARRGGN